MKHAACVGFLLLGALTVELPAQMPAQHRGLFLGFAGYTTTTTISAVGHVSPDNTWTTYPTQSSGPWPYWGDLVGATLDADNANVIVPAWDGRSGPTTPNRYVFAVWDPKARSVVSTLWSGPYNQGVPRSVTNITLNSDGDLAAYDQTLDQFVVFDRIRKTWKAVTPPVISKKGGMGGFEWDKLNGGYYHASGQYDYEQALFKTSWDFKSTSLLASGYLNVLAYYGGSMLDDRTWVSSSVRNGTYLYVEPSKARWDTSPLTALGVFTEVSHEKYAAAGRGCYAGFLAWHSLANRGIAHVDISTTPHTVSTLIAGPYPNAVSSVVMEIVPLGERDLMTVRSGKSTWDVRIDPAVPYLAGRPYVLAASLAGAAPPIVLPDGREIFLVPDRLSLLTVRGAFAPFLTGNIGTLDSSGKASAKLDFTALGTVANGTPIHLCAIVFDPGGPHGIGWVSDPWAFVINVEP